MELSRPKARPARARAAQRQPASGRQRQPAAARAASVAAPPKEQAAAVEVSPGIEHLEIWSTADVVKWVAGWDHTYHRVLAFWTPEMTASLEAEEADGMLLAGMTVDEMAERFGLGKEQAYLFNSALGRIERLFPAETEFADLDSISLDDGEDLTQMHTDPTIMPSLVARLERIKQLEKAVGEPTTSAADALGAFDMEAATDNLVIGQIAVSDVVAICNAADKEVAELDSRTRDLQQRREQALVEKGDDARDRLADEQQHINEKLRRLEMHLVHVERDILRQLRRKFRQREERMRVHLENNQAIMQQADGRVSLSAKTFGHTNRCYAIEWANALQV